MQKVREIANPSLILSSLVPTCFKMFQVGYGARYYSYLLARSVASNIWQKFFKNNPYDSDKGGEYRKNCLSHGGAKPSPKIIEDLLGHSVDPVQLSDALLQEIDEKQELIAKLFK